MPTNPGTTNLVSWWSLDEASGTRVDSHGSNDLTDNNTVTSTTGVLGDASVHVRANTEYLSAAGIADFSGASVFSYAGWFRKTAAVGGPTTISLSTGSASPFLMLTAAATYEHQVKIGSDFGKTARSYALNTWYHLAAVFDGAGATNADRLKFYVNGSAVSLTFTGTIAATMLSGTSTAYLGASYASGISECLDGNLDETSLWTKALSADEVAFLYNSGAGVIYTDVAGGGLAQPLSGPFARALRGAL